MQPPPLPGPTAPGSGELLAVSKRELNSNVALFLDEVVPYLRIRAANAVQLVLFGVGEKLLTISLTWLHEGLFSKVAWLSGFIDQIDALTFLVVYLAFGLLALAELAALCAKRIRAAWKSE